MDTFKHLKEYTRPECYAGATWEGYYDVAGRNRDSDILSNSNWDCWLAFLTKLLGSADTVIGFDEDSGDEVYNWTVCRENHWACGWIEIIRVHCSLPTEKLKAIDDQLHKLDGYPVFNEDHFSAAEEREYLRCWREAGAAYDFRRAIREAFEKENTGDEELVAMLDKLDEVSVDNLIALHERLIPCGEYHHDGWPCIDLSVEAMTWEDLENLTK